jgi:glutaredoxin
MLQKDMPAVREAVGKADVILFSKKGCSFCVHATAILDENKIDYTMFYPEGRDVSDLKTTLGVPIMAFPAIFVRGRYIGSVDKLEDAMQSGLLDELLAMPMDPLGKLPDPMTLTVAARGGTIFAFQRYIYGNWTRAWHLVQVLCFLAIAALVQAQVASDSLVPALVYLLLLDWVLFIVLGPVPAPLGTLCLALVWRFRGPAVPAVPYKVRQAAYVAAFYTIARDFNLTIVELGVLGAHIANSAYIAFFRF